MRTLLTLGFGALIAVGVVLWIIMMAVGFLVVSFFGFLEWMTGEGLPVTIIATLVALGFGVTVLMRRKRNVSLGR